MSGALLGEALATSDLPPGVINILTGCRAELLPHIANHREIRALTAANLTDDESTILRRGSAENLKRVSVRNRATTSLRGTTHQASTRRIELMRSTI